MDYLTQDEPEHIPARYSDRDLWVPASNDRGETKAVTYSLPPDIVRLVGELVESREFPWKKQSDAFRWFTIEGLRALKNVMPHLIPELRRVEAMMEYLRSEHRRQMHVKMVDRMQETIEGYLDLGAPEEARRVVSNVAERIREWEGDDNAWVRAQTVEKMSKYLKLFDHEHNPFEGL